MNNKLTNEFISTMFTKLEANKNIGHVGFTRDNIRDVLYTIWKINMLEMYDTNLSGEIGLTGYGVPPVFADLVFPPVSIDGTNDTQRLVVFTVDEEVTGKILTKSEMYTIGNAIYGSRRKSCVLQNVDSTTATGAKITDYLLQLTVDERSTGIGFVLGTYPIHPVQHMFVKPHLASMSIAYAMDEYFLAKLQMLEK